MFQATDVSQPRHQKPTMFFPTHSQKLVAGSEREPGDKADLRKSLAQPHRRRYSIISRQGEIPAVSKEKIESHVHEPVKLERHAAPFVAFFFELACALLLYLRRPFLLSRANPTCFRAHARPAQRNTRETTHSRVSHQP